VPAIADTRFLFAVADATGSQLAPYGATGVAAWRGREAEATALGDHGAGQQRRMITVVKRRRDK
jgi:hypothetical protein